MESSIRENIENNVYHSRLRYKRISILSSYEIIDENKSDAWNREEVERRNEESYKYRERFRRSKQDGEDKFKKDIIEMIMKNYSTSYEDANKIYYKAYQDVQSEEFDEILDKVKEIIQVSISEGKNL